MGYTWQRSRVVTTSAQAAAHVSPLDHVDVDAAAAAAAASATVAAAAAAATVVFAAVAAAPETAAPAAASDAPTTTTCCCNQYISGLPSVSGCGVEECITISTNN